MALPAVWLPEADVELKHARAWYDNIPPELGERFALAVEATVEAIAEHLASPTGFEPVLPPLKGA